MNLNPNAYALIGLTAMVAALIGVLVFAVLRFASAARESRQASAGEPERVGVRHRGPARSADQAESAGARDVGARRSLRAAQQRNRREPVVGPARRRERRAASHPESRGPPAAEPRRLGACQAVSNGSAGCARAARRRVSEQRGADRPPNAANQLGRSIPGVSGRQRVAAVERPGRAARRDLPVHRSDAGRRNGRAAPIEREPCASRRADRGHRS